MQNDPRNFLTKRSGPRRPPDHRASLRAIAKVHDAGPQVPLPLSKRAAPVATDDVDAMILTNADRRAQRYAREHGPRATQLSQRGVAAIRKAHATGPRPLPGDFLSKVEVTVVSRPTLSLRKRAPAKFAPPGTRWENIRGTWLQVRHDGRGKSQVVGSLRKGVKFPPQSDDASNATDIADTGATNDFDDEGTESPTPELLGGFSDVNVPQKDPRIVAAVAMTPREKEVDAIKQCLLPQNKLRMMP